jgi:hypothetical protein
MASSGMLRSVALVRTDVSEEHSASFIRVTRIGELRTTLAVTSNRCTLPSSPILVTLMEARSSSETSVLTRATLHNIPEDAILPSHRCEILKSYTVQSLLVSVDEYRDITLFPEHNCCRSRTDSRTLVVTMSVGPAYRKAQTGPSR